MFVLDATLSRGRKNCAIGIDNAAETRNKRALRMFTRAVNSRFERVRQQAIVSIQKNEELATALSQAFVPRASKAGILLENILDAGVKLDDIRGAVGRAIVHYDELEIGITLR